MQEGQSFRQMVLEQVDIHRQKKNQNKTKKEYRPKHHTSYKHLSATDHELKHKM